MKPRNVANWIKTNLERMIAIMDLKEIKDFRKRTEDQEVIRERQESTK